MGNKMERRLLGNPVINREINITLEGSIDFLVRKREQLIELPCEDEF